MWVSYVSYRHISVGPFEFLIQPLSSPHLAPIWPLICPMCASYVAGTMFNCGNIATADINHCVQVRVSPTPVYRPL